MEKKSLLKKFGRRIRIGFIGGGIDSVVGDTHLAALRMDGKYELVAGVMSINKKISKLSGLRQLIDKNRIYENYAEMAYKESLREDKIDVVVILTPPDSHIKIASEFIKKNIDVICEKPLSTNLFETLKFKKLLKKSKNCFILNHCYTAYPLVREAKELIKQNTIGKILVVESELCAGIPDDPKDKNNKTSQHFRFKKSMGKGILLGEVGSHPLSLVSYITGLKITKISSYLETIVKKREVFDNGYINIKYNNKAIGRMWVSYIAQGNDHGLSFRIHGEKGALIWHQEEPNQLLLKQNNSPVKIFKPAHSTLHTISQLSSRLRPGHPEGLLSAFANLYSEFAEAIFAKKLNQNNYKDYLKNLPSVEDGIDVLKAIKASLKSNEKKGKWTDL